MKKLAPLLLCCFGLGSCATENPDSQPSRIWHSSRDLDDVAGCINVAFTKVLTPHGGYPTSIETVVPQQEYRISETGRQVGLLLATVAPKTFVVTLKRTAGGTAIEYRAYHLAQARDHRLIEGCLPPPAEPM